MPDGDSFIRIDEDGSDDKRVLTTKYVVLDALVRLVGQTDINKISITRLCQEAGINRGTFYNHWKSIEELVANCEDAYVERVCECLHSHPFLNIEKAVAYLSNGYPDPALVAAFKSLKPWGEFHMAILGPNGDKDFAGRFHNSILDNYREYILGLGLEFEIESDVEYAAAYYAGAFMGIVAHWMTGGCKESPEKMALKMMRLSLYPLASRINL